jgi:hypothetical protein
MFNYQQGVFLAYVLHIASRNFAECYHSANETYKLRTHESQLAHINLEWFVGWIICHDRVKQRVRSFRVSSLPEVVEPVKFNHDWSRWQNVSFISNFLYCFDIIDRVSVMSVLFSILCTVSIIDRVRNQRFKSRKLLGD